MHNTHTTPRPATVLAFPLHRARPPLAVSVARLAQEAWSDRDKLLWDCLPKEHEDRVEPSYLCGMLPTPDTLRTPGTVLDPHTAADFAVLGLFAIQTGQWMRPDLVEDLVALQHQADTLLPAKAAQG